MLYIQSTKKHHSLSDSSLAITFPTFCDKTFEFTIQTWLTSLEHYYYYYVSQLRKMLILLISKCAHCRHYDLTCLSIIHCSVSSLWDSTLTVWTPKCFCQNMLMMTFLRGCRSCSVILIRHAKQLTHAVSDIKLSVLRLWQWSHQHMVFRS